MLLTELILLWFTPLHCCLMGVDFWTTESSKYHVLAPLQYADDAALPSHSPSGLQDNLNALADAYHRAGLIINTKKTEILSPIQSPSSQLTFTVHGDTLNTTQQFTYLGSILSSDSDLTNEIQQRVNSHHQLSVDLATACSSTAT